MSGRATLAVTTRVLTQLRRDRRTLALMLVVPLVLLTLLRYMFDGAPLVFDRVGGTMIGVFPLTVMFVVTSVAMLRERTQGTLERLMTMPIGKADLLLGYGAAFAVLGIVQATLATTYATQLLGVDVAGPLPLVIVFAVGNSLLGMSLGLLCSAFAETEFQAVQFLPAVILPQVVLCGLFAPRDQMAEPLYQLSRVLPMTYGYDGLLRVTVLGSDLGDGDVVRDLVVVAAVTLGAVLAGSLTLRRRAR